MTLAADYAKLDQPEVTRRLFAPRLDPGGTPLPGAVDHLIAVADHVRVHARFHLAGPEDPNILFFHGNGEIVSDYDDVGPQFVAQHMSLLAVDYRGYGLSDGESTATAMLHDAHVIFSEVQRWLAAENRTGPLLVMGRSLGSAPALELAAEHGDAIAALIIESGFAFTAPLLECIGVDTVAAGITEADGFKNMLKITRCPQPTLIIHAQHDQIIPVSDADTLQVQSAAHSKELQVVPKADHNTIIARTGALYFQVIGRFASRIARAKKRPGRRR